MKKDKITIEFVENKIGFKLNFPNQFIEGNIDDEKYSELLNFGCSDIWDTEGHWLHRDCFHKKCSTCNFYPVVKEYYDKNNIENETEMDIEKASLLNKLLWK